MRKDFGSKAFMFIVVILFLAAGSVYGEPTPKRENTAQGFLGQVKSIDCAKGEFTLTGKKGKGEGVFVLGKDVEFKSIKGCEEVPVGGVLLVYYSEAEGKKIAKSVRLMRRNKETGTRPSPQPAAGKINVFMGWVNSVDCDKGSIALEKLDDKSIVESFSLGKDTAVEVGPSSKCADIQKGSVVAVVFDEKDNGKVARKVRQMAGGKR